MRNGKNLTSQPLGKLKCIDFWLHNIRNDKTWKRTNKNICNLIKHLKTIFWQVSNRVARSLESDQPISSLSQSELCHSSSCQEVSTSFSYLQEVWIQFGLAEAHHSSHYNLSSQIIKVLRRCIYSRSTFPNALRGLHYRCYGLQVYISQHMVQLIPIKTFNLHFKVHLSKVHKVYLSKGTSGYKQKCTQLPTQFSQFFMLFDIV